MTEQQHPIVPPLDLIKTWMIEYYGGEIPGGFAGDEVYLCKCAAQWGADQELEACRMEIIDGVGRTYFDETRHRVLMAENIWAARRPKPPSLKEQALEQLETIQCLLDMHELRSDTIRRALEQLDD
jgi:hypothetical protein